MNALATAVLPTYITTNVYIGLMTTTASPASTGELELGIVGLRGQLGPVIDLVHHRGVVTHIFRGRRRMAVLISAERYDELVGRAHADSPVRGDELAGG
jgi:hypothetical protein